LLDVLSLNIAFSPGFSRLRCGRFFCYS